MPTPTPQEETPPSTSHLLAFPCRRSSRGQGTPFKPQPRPGAALSPSALSPQPSALSPSALSPQPLNPQPSAPQPSALSPSAPQPSALSLPVDANPQHRSPTLPADDNPASKHPIHPTPARAFHMPHPQASRRRSNWTHLFELHLQAPHSRCLGTHPAKVHSREPINDEPKSSPIMPRPHGPSQPHLSASPWR
ncbi:uncharacterized protein [Penaeus vannamei]|uniref:uncharacterized protein n=1 Tax=Penaeus vannamei TaxID=6689 RepID=UPI00387FA6F6